MSFVTDPVWQVLCLVASICWLMLLLREVYRFRLLQGRSGQITTYLSALLVLAWTAIIIVMAITTGLLSALLTFLIFFLAAGVTLAIIRERRQPLLHPESLAQAEYKKDQNVQLIERVISRDDVVQLLAEHGQQKDSLMNFMQWLVHTGHRDLLRKLDNIEHINNVLKICSQEGGTPVDRFVDATVYLMDN